MQTTIPIKEGSRAGEIAANARGAFGMSSAVSIVRQSGQILAHAQTIQEQCCNIWSDSMSGGAELFPTVNGRG
jgi:hypothetical protein